MEIYIRNSQRAIRLNQRRIGRDLRKALSLLGFQTAELSVLFIGKKRMRLLNAGHRGIDRPTDVLSFPMHEGGPPFDNPVLGDIVICVPVAVRQAAENGSSLYDEIQRLLVHGLLHLLGFDHEGPAAFGARMRRKERSLLNALKKMDPQR